MLWLVVLYLGSLATLFAASVWSVDSFTGLISHTFTTANFTDLFTNSIYRIVALRTLGVAVLVTVLDRWRRSFCLRSGHKPKFVTGLRQNIQRPGH